MSIADFVKQIDPDTLSHIIANFFDEIMVLYNLIGDRRDLAISKDREKSAASFILTMQSEDDASSLYNNLNNTAFTIYNDKYIIEMALSGRNINTAIYKTIS